MFLSLGLRLVLKNKLRWRHAHLVFSDETKKKEQREQRCLTPKIRTATMIHQLFWVFQVWACRSLLYLSQTMQQCLFDFFVLSSIHSERTWCSFGWLFLEAFVFVFSPLLEKLLLRSSSNRTWLQTRAWFNAYATSDWNTVWNIYKG